MKESGAVKQETLSRVMVIAAHPDDPEYGCAGTVTKWASEGKEITFLLLTSGDKGSKDPSLHPGRLATIREREQEEAARELGIRKVIFQRHPDGLLENTMGLRRELAGVLRVHRPHIVLTIDPWRHYQTHPDHRAAGLAALDAVYAAKEVNLYPEQLVGDIAPWRVNDVYLFWTDSPDYWEDVGCCIERRIVALSRHVSQVDEEPAALGKSIRENARKVAEKSGLGYEYAEAFKHLSV
jgi:LmbE family N-acetylglucosaminyl deacetylase